MISHPGSSVISPTEFIISPSNQSPQVDLAINSRSTFQPSDNEFHFPIMESGNANQNDDAGLHYKQHLYIRKKRETLISLTYALQ